MRVLFWVEPAADFESPGLYSWWGRQLIKFDSALRGACENYESALCSFEAFSTEDIEGYKGDWVRLSYQEIYQAQTAGYPIHHALRSEKAGLGLAEKVLSRLGDGFHPDVVFLFSDFPALRSVFPSAAFLHVEFSWFARGPFPEFYQLDPFGYGKGRFASENYDFFNDRVISGAERRFLQIFRDKARRSVSTDAAEDLLARIRAEHPERNVVLMPLAERYILDGSTPISVAVDRILANAPSDHFYVITMHPIYGCFNDFELRWLAKKYSNFEFCPDGIDSTSLIAGGVDFVVGDFSSVALYGLIFGVEVLSCLEALPQFDAHLEYRNPLGPRLVGLDQDSMDRLLFNLLMYSVIPPGLIFDGEWLSSYLHSVVRLKKDKDIPRFFECPVMSMEDWYQDAWLIDEVTPKIKENPEGQQIFSSAKDFSGRLRAIAFYLPQFHRIPQNDEWWGEGFTEWTNVRQGRPLFEGHYQPRVPSELGYYDLSDVQVMAQQAELARKHGIEGFCFYHYWFDGKRLLEKPVDQLLAHPEIDLPFCLCWANENWTRRWDGAEQEVLMKQTYSPELGEQFALDLLPYMQDPRYIRVDGKPLLLIYRSDIIPNLVDAVSIWRDTWRKNGVGEVYLVCVESFRAIDPRKFGFDASCEFLPHQLDISAVQDQRPYGKDFDATTSVADYRKVADFWPNRTRPSYKRFRGLVPAWDNSARRQKGGAVVIHGSTPQLYESWLRRTAAYTLFEYWGDERLIFINAWNEWGEGCYLEPDERYGRAYLEATHRVLSSDPVALMKEFEAQRPKTAMQAWYAARTVIPAQQDLARKHWAGRLSKIRVVLLDLHEDAEGVQLTLASLRNDAGGFIFEPILLSKSSVPPKDYSGKFFRIHPRSVSSALNDILGSLESGWFICVEAGERFTPGGLHLAQVEITSDLPCAAVYADELVSSDRDLSAIFRPDFNLDLLLSLPSAMAKHWIFRVDQFKALGGFDGALQESYELDYILRLIEQVGMGGVGHLSEPLVLCDATKLATVEEELQVIRRHLARRGYQDSTVCADLPGRYRLDYGHPEKPLVSIIIPTKDQLPMLLRCITSLLEKTRYPNFEVIIVDNNSETQEARDWLAGVEQMGSEKVRVLRYPHPFNYSAINNLAAREARGEYLLLLNNDTAILQEDWLDALMNHGQRPEVGIVGAKLLYPNGRVQHAGVILGLRGPADHPFIGSEADHPGYMHRMQVDQNLTAVTAACLLIRKSIYEQVGGLDEEAFKVSYNDVDLCLKVHSAGYLIVWTPHSVVMHVGSVSQRSTDKSKVEDKRKRFGAEQDAMFEKWLPLIARDPAYNPNLTLLGTGYEVEDSRLTWRPLSWRPLPVVLAHMADTMGCGHYRVIQPFSAAKEAGLIDGAVSDRLLSVPELERFKPDAIVFQRQLTDIQLEIIERSGKFSSAFKVYELDDYILNIPVKSAHRGVFSNDIQKSLRRALGMMDRFVVSTEPLADRYSKLHGDIHVVKNTLDPRWWKGLVSERRISDKPRVGWAGGISHTGDLEMIADVVKALADEVEWVFFGMCPAKLRPYVHEYYPAVAIEQYPAALARLNLDLAIAPVEQNPFNECKSNLRLLEYGACGFPVVCSDLTCYQGDLPVTRVRNRFKDWVDAIRMHLADLDATAKQGDALRAAVHESWMLEGANLEQWRKAWLP